MNLETIANPQNRQHATHVKNNKKVKLQKLSACEVLNKLLLKKIKCSHIREYAAYNVLI
jgi:hypothetical protein